MMKEQLMCIESCPKMNLHKHLRYMICLIGMCMSRVWQVRSKNFNLEISRPLATFKIGGLGDLFGDFGNFSLAIELSGLKINLQFRPFKQPNTTKNTTNNLACLIQRTK